MPGEPINPYAPPADDVSEVEIPGIWRVEGDCLIVREGAVLPPVDLDGRGAGGPLTPILLRLPVGLDAKGLAIPVAGAALMLGYLFLMKDRSGGLGMRMIVGIVVVSVVGQLLPRDMKIRTIPVGLFGTVSVPALRAITRRAQLRGRIAWISAGAVGLTLALMLTFSRWAGSVDLMMEMGKTGLLVLCVSLLVLLGLLIWQTLDQGWRCSRVRDGWVWVKGLGPIALAELSALSMQSPPSPVTRQVFQMNLEKIPPAFWRQAHGSGPLGGVRTFWFKQAAKGRLLHPCFHWSERDWLAPDQADSELVAAWQRDADRTPLADWAMAYAIRVNSPSGCIQMNRLVFLSPDGRYAAMPTITRVSVGRKLKETRETSFRSFTKDARIIATGTVEAIEPLPEPFDFVLVKASVFQVSQAHFQRAAAEDLVTLDVGELRRREELEMQMHHEAMEAAGIFSPVEKIEFPGRWGSSA